MDIHAWLQTTADREPPDPHSDDHRAEPGALHHKADDTRPTRKSHRRRQRASSETPLSAAPRHSRRKQPIAPARPSSSAHVQRRAGPESLSSGSTSSSSSSRQSPHAQPPKAHERTFEKRARHKTKPDRYDHKAKRRKETSGARKRNDEPRTKRRNSRRSGDGTATAGLVQSFQLKNGPKHNRLTLKPDVSAGIFRHGRSSGPVAPAGKGLPDLVFNEMRFLQNPKEHQNELPEGERLKQSVKKSRKDLQEEEVSSFFANRPQTARVPERARSPRARNAAAEGDVNRSQAVNGTAGRPQIELPDNMFLGFGSRGPSHDVSAVPKDSNSYYTWSESLPRDLSARKRGRDVRTDATGMPPPAQRRHCSRLSNTSAPVLGHTVPSSGPIGARKAERLQHPDHPVLAETSPQRTMGQRRRTTTVASSQSLPKAEAISKVTGPKDDGTSGSTFRTSDILNLANPLAGADVLPAVLERSDKHQYPNVISSGPESEILRQAFDAVARLERPATPRLHEQASRQRRHDSHGAGGSTGSMFTINQMSNEIHGALEERTPRWSFPQRGFSRASDVNRSQQEPSIGFNTALRTSSRQTLSQYQAPHVYQSLQRIEYGQDEEMLDDLPETIPAPPLPPSQHTYYDHRPTADILPQSMAEQEDYASEPASLHYQDEGQQFPAESIWTDVPAHQTFEEEHEVVSERQLFDDTVEQGIMNESQPFDDTIENEVNSEDIDNDLVGFWRPNKLY